MRGRGAKGSIKDRLLSILYRIRYNRKLKKKQNYYKKNKIKLSFVYNPFFKKYKVRLIKINPKKNIKSHKIYKRRKHVGIGIDNTSINNKIKNNKLLINTKKILIKEQVYISVSNKNYFIKNDSNNKISNEKYKEEKINLKENKLYISNINTRIKKRKFKKGIGENYNIVNANKKNLSNLPKLKENKINFEKELTHKEPVNKTYRVKKKKKKGIGVKPQIKLVKDNKYKVLKTLKLKQEKIKNIKDIDEKIKKEIEEQKIILKSMKDKVSKIDVITSKRIKLSGFSRIISSILKIATGFLTLPFTGSNIFGIMLGTSLVNKGIRELRKGLNKEEITTINYNYEDLKYKILKSKDKIGDTRLLIDDSLEQIELLKKEFNNKFKDYKTIDPLYDEILKDISNIETELINKKKEIDNIDKNLSKQYELNKIKLKKINKN